MHRANAALRNADESKLLFDFTDASAVQVWTAIDDRVSHHTPASCRESGPTVRLQLSRHGVGAHSPSSTALREWLHRGCLPARSTGKTRPEAAVQTRERGSGMQTFNGGYDLLEAIVLSLTCSGCDALL